MEKNEKLKRKGLIRTWLENRPKVVYHKLKVMDFTIMNGIKFGFGVFFGLALAALSTFLFLKTVEIFTNGLMYIPLK